MTDLPTIDSNQNGTGDQDMTTTDYDSFGQVFSTTDADGCLTMYGYDTAQGDTGALIPTVVQVDRNDPIKDISTGSISWDGLRRPLETYDGNDNKTDYQYVDRMALSGVLTMPEADFLGSATFYQCLQRNYRQLNIQ